jgi:hypothetical protein
MEIIPSKRRMKMKIDMKTLGWILVCLCVLGLSPATAGTSKLEVRWNELSPLILAHTVSLVLPGGTAIAGEVEAVHDDSLTLEIRKTSNRKVQPKGTASIPRTSVTTLQMTEAKGSGGRILGVVVGALVGLVAGSEIAVHTCNTEGPAAATLTGVAVGVTTAGYHLGKGVDRHTTIIRVVRE